MLVTELGIVGGVVNEVHPDRKELPILVTEVGIVGGVVSEVHPYTAIAFWHDGHGITIRVAWL
jgi:hypothetical protein